MRRIDLRLIADKAGVARCVLGSNETQGEFNCHS
jgi:hypothetical protein